MLTETLYCIVSAKMVKMEGVGASFQFMNVLFIRHYVPTVKINISHVLTKSYLRIQC